MKTLGRRMAAARAAKKMTVQAVADALNKAKSTISQWENDIYQPSLADIERLSLVLGVNQNWLAFGTEPVLTATEQTPLSQAQ